MADISLTAGMRANLLQLQSTGRLLDRTQQRIATGKKVNTALDGPAAYFAAKALTDRAGDLATLKESMGQAISTIKAADNAITSITTLVQQAKAVANTAKANLGTDTAAIASRESSASQFDELMSQINALVDDAGYAGKNLLLGDGAVYAATSQSIANVDTLTGVSSTSISNIGGGTSANNITVAVEGAVTENTTSANTVETALGFTTNSIDAVGFTAGGTVTVDAYDDGTSNFVRASNTYSSGYSTFDDAAAATTYTQYLVSTGSAATTQSTLGITDFEVINWSDNEDIAIAVTSASGTTTFSVTAPTTNANLYTAAQTETDSAGYDWQTFVWGDTANTVASMYFLSSSATDFSITSVAADSSGNEVVSFDITATHAVASSTSYSLVVTYADGSTATSTAQVVVSAAGAASISLSVGSTIVSFTSEANAAASTSTTSISLTTVKFQGAGAGGGGSSTGSVTVDVGSFAFNTAGSDNSGLVAGTGQSVTLDDARDIKITQGSLTYTRAVEPGSGEGTLSTGTNTFVLSNGAAVSMSVDLNILTSGTQTLAAYTSTAAGTSNDMQVFFNEDSTSSVTITSVKSNADGLGVANAANSWYDAADIDQAITQLDAALASLRTVGQTLTNNLSIVQTREDYTSTFINTLEEGADKWTLADSNEEGANMLMLQTRQQLGTVSLSIASQSAQSILRLFG